MKWSKKSKVIIGLLFFALLFAYSAFRFVYQPHKSIENQEATFEGSAVDFKKVFNMSEKEWQNSIIQIRGVITNSNSKGAVMDENIYCQFKQETQSLKEGQVINIKGRFIGYDDLLEEIKLKDCIIIK